jgi:hypothetical protein
MHKSEVTLTLTRDGKELYSRTGRLSKEVKLFVKQAIEKKWVMKWDVFGIVKNTMQFNNIWEYFEALKKSEKEKGEEE